MKMVVGIVGTLYIPSYEKGRWIDMAGVHIFLFIHSFASQHQCMSLRDVWCCQNYQLALKL